MPGQKPECEETLRNLLITICASENIPPLPSFWIVNGVSTDIMAGGLRTCVFWLSGMLLPFEWDIKNHKPLCEFRHSGLDGFIKDLFRCGWQSMGSRGPLLPGDIIHWSLASSLQEGEIPTEHIGFSLGGDLAASTDPCAKGAPRFHHWQYKTDGSESRPVITLFRHPYLAEQVSSLYAP